MGCCYFCIYYIYLLVGSWVSAIGNIYFYMQHSFIYFQPECAKCYFLLQKLHLPGNNLTCPVMNTHHVFCVGQKSNTAHEKNLMLHERVPFPRGIQYAAGVISSYQM